MGFIKQLIEDKEEILISQKSLKKLFKHLKEHAVYRVRVKCSKNNVEHTAFLFTGFNTGSYWTVFNNSYDDPIRIQECYSITILKLVDTDNDGN